MTAPALLNVLHIEHLNLCLKMNSAFTKIYQLSTSDAQESELGMYVHCSGGQRHVSVLLVASPITLILLKTFFIYHSYNWFLTC